MLNQKKIGVVIAAGGSGQRMGLLLPKQFLELDGKPIILRTLNAFQQSTVIDTVIISAREEDIVLLRKLVDENALTKVSAIVCGGKERQDSVWQGMVALKEQNVNIVLIHDAVRPFISQEIIRSVTSTAIEHDAAIVAVKAKDTIKLSSGNGFAESTLDREKTWIVQTPQAFEFALLWQAFEKAQTDKYYGTDDASLIERIDRRIKIVEGSYSNIKITTNDDIAIAEAIIRSLQVKTLSSAH